MPRSDPGTTCFAGSREPSLASPTSTDALGCSARCLHTQVCESETAAAGGGAGIARERRAFALERGLLFPFTRTKSGVGTGEH